MCTVITCVGFLDGPGYGPGIWQKEKIMTYTRLKKTLTTVALSAALILTAGFASTSVAVAQYREHRWGWQQRNREHPELQRIRRLDRERQLRYRMNGSIRTVGYYDRFGRFHSYGFYDRFGRFHRY